jgi:hypothetical protein
MTKHKEVSPEEFVSEDAYLKLSRAIQDLPGRPLQSKELQSQTERLQGAAWIYLRARQHPVSKKVAQQELRKLSRLCEELTAHIHSMSKQSLDQIVWPGEWPFGGDSIARQRERIVGPGAEAARKARAEWENLNCPSPFQIAEDVKRLSAKATNSLPNVEPTAGGRPKKSGVAQFARYAAEAYEHKTQRRVTIVTREEQRATGSFIQFLGELFDLFSVDASPEAQARAFLKQRRKVSH